jgi:hypothetical protein
MSSYLKGRPIVANKQQPWKKAPSEPNGSSGWASKLPSNLSALRNIPAELNYARMVETSVLVSVQNVDLADFSDRVYEELDAKLITVGGSMPNITKEDLLKYFATALFSRVMWVNRTMRPNSYRPDEEWALPIPMTYVVSAIGRVQSEDGPTYVPVWDAGGDDLILARTEWELLTRKLRALEPFGLRFIRALEKDVKGVDDVMSILRLETPDGAFFYGNVPPHAFECLCALIAGLSPVVPVEMPTHPALLPKYRLRGEWVLQWRHEFATLSTHRDVV